MFSYTRTSSGGPPYGQGRAAPNHPLVPHDPRIAHTPVVSDRKVVVIVASRCCEQCNRHWSLQNRVSQRIVVGSVGVEVEAWYQMRGLGMVSLSAQIEAERRELTTSMVFAIKGLRPAFFVCIHDFFAPEFA